MLTDKVKDVLTWDDGLTKDQCRILDVQTYTLHNQNRRKDEI